LATGFPYSKTIITIRSRQTNQKTGKVSQETRYYLSSQYDFERSSEEWINLSRQHWAGIESRNHWRRDATMGEDRTRLSNPNALANLALIRNLNLHVLARQSWDGWLPGLIERLAANPAETCIKSQVITEVLDGYLVHPIYYGDEIYSQQQS
jgi:predicted transposase YbfD/YdcC